MGHKQIKIKAKGGWSIKIREEYDNDPKKICTMGIHHIESVKEKKKVLMTRYLMNQTRTPLQI